MPMKLCSYLIIVIFTFTFGCGAVQAASQDAHAIKIDPLTIKKKVPQAVRPAKIQKKNPPMVTDKGKDTVQLLHVDKTTSTNELRFNINKLRTGINAESQMLQDSTQQAQDLMVELRQLNMDILQRQQKIAALKKKVSAQQSVLDASQNKLDALMRQSAPLRNHLIKRLRAYYLMGHYGFFNITFSGKTLPELLIASEAFKHLSTYDRALFTDYRKNITDIQEVTRANQLEKSVLDNFLADAGNEEQALQKSIAEKSGLLEKAQAEGASYKQSLAAMYQAEKELTAKLKIRQKNDPSTKYQNILLAQGQLPPPVTGQLISQFHADGNASNDIFNNGISIKTLPNSDVECIFSGTVLFAGPMEGYGNLIIIDHQNQYYSVNARLGKMLVHQGDSVTSGKVIGTTRPDSNQPAGAFYFEIRHDAVAEDPVTWLSPGSLERL